MSACEMPLVVRSQGKWMPLDWTMKPTKAAIATRPCLISAWRGKAGAGLGEGGRAWAGARNARVGQRPKSCRCIPDTQADLRSLCDAHCEATCEATRQALLQADDPNPNPKSLYYLAEEADDRLLARERARLTHAALGESEGVVEADRGVELLRQRLEVRRLPRASEGGE